MNYYKIEQINYTNQIIIEKINLKQKYNSFKISNVDEGIVLLKGTNVKKDLYFLAAHSGSSDISYFKNLHKLKLDDKIDLYFDGKKNTFFVKEIYYVKKNGRIIVPKDSKNTLYLTTCDKNNEFRQLIVKSVKKM